MPEQQLPSSTSGRNLGPEDIANRTFPSARKGLDSDAVRRFLVEVAAQVRELRAERAELLMSASVQREVPPSPPVAETIPDEAILTKMLGEEMTRVLQTARESAATIVSKAERHAEEVVAQAESQSRALHVDAEADAISTRDHALVDAAALIEKTKSECRDMIDEAREARRKILADLADRRRALLVQLEQVRVGKEAIAAVVESVASTVTDSIASVRSQLHDAEEHSRHAAEHAAIEFSPLPEEPGDIDALIEQVVVQIPDLETPPSAAESIPSAHVVSEARVYDIERELSRQSLESSSRLPKAASTSSKQAADVADHSPPNETPLMRTPDQTPTASQVKRTEPSSQDATKTVAPAESPLNEEDAHDANPVDELFAKIRASRESRTADAQKVLEEKANAQTKRHAVGHRRNKDQEESATGEGVEIRATDGGIELDRNAESDASAEVPGADSSEEGRASLLRAERDALLSPVALELARSMKRILREEQNLLLDALRNRKKGAALSSLLPNDAMRDRLVAAFAPNITSAFHAGGVFLGRTDVSGEGAPSDTDQVSTVSTKLATEVIDAIRARIEPSFVGDAAEEQELPEAVGAAFRDWKAARVESLAHDFAVEAFGVGEIAYAREANISLTWNLDDAGKDCPDCDDNGVAGLVNAGAPYPTGHLHPPVHPGCRCFLSR